MSRTDPLIGALRAVLRSLRRPWWLVAAVAVLWLASGLFVVDKQEHGVVVRFGAVVRDRVPPGLHAHAPWPIARAHVVDTSTNHSMSVGFKLRDKVMGIPTPPEQSRWLTGDLNIVEVRMIVQYRAVDPAATLFACDDPDRLVRHAGEAVVTDLVGHLAVDDVLTTRRGELVTRSELQIQQRLEAWGCGLAVTSVHFEGLDPPREVLDAFQEVQSAEADNRRLLQEAEGYANTVLPDARGEAAAQVAAARAFREQRVAEAEGWRKRFGALSAAAREAPRETRQRLYLEAAERVLGRVELVIVEPAGGGERQRIVVVQPRAAAATPEP